MLPSWWPESLVKELLYSTIQFIYISNNKKFSYCPLCRRLAYSAVYPQHLQKNSDTGPPSFEWSVQSFAKSKGCFTGLSSLQATGPTGWSILFTNKKDEYCPLYKWPTKIDSDHLQKMFRRTIFLEQQKSRNSGSTRSVVSSGTDHLIIILRSALSSLICQESCRVFAGSFVEIKRPVASKN